MPPARGDEETTLIVLGGNAFARPGEPLTMAGQFDFARQALAQLRPLLENRSRLVLTHGNGPQVGQMLARVEAALGEAYAVPLEVCVAESEGELGYVLEQTLHNLLAEWGALRPIASLLTQVVVDRHDPAFDDPTKPIGRVYSPAQAVSLKDKGLSVREDSGRGYRRVVPSPQPVEILETSVVETLLDAGVLVICAGGGGIPVVRENETLQGVEAVVDKDLTSALLGELLGANRMVILTDVPCAYRNYRTSRQERVGVLNVSEARNLVDEGHFAPGSMKPKIEASIRFASRPGAEAVICGVDGLAEALQGRSGTIIRSVG